MSSCVLFVHAALERPLDLPALEGESSVAQPDRRLLRSESEEQGLERRGEVFAAGRRDQHRDVVCPTEALIDGFALVQQSTGNFVRKPVVVEAVRGSQAEIKDGLFPGDKVVTVGSHELAALFAKLPAKHTSSTQSTGTTAQGQIELPTDQKTFASAPIEGRVRRILVEHGQHVRKGEVLAELDSLPLRSLQLDLLQARTSLCKQQRTSRAWKRLGDTVARKEYWKLQTERDKLRQTVSSLEKQLSILRG